MPRGTVKVPVNPDVMRWARESAGLSIQDVSRILNISVATVYEWEQKSGTKKPTLSSLKKLASYYKRPLAAFFLPVPPQEPPMPKDFRVLPDEGRRPLSKKTLLSIRRARYLQSIATELIEADGTLEKLLVGIGRVSLLDDPESIASRERLRLGVTLEKQHEFKSPHEAFQSWREALEGLNILIYQARIPPEELRGFSLLDNLLPTIVVSLSDSINARIFTLFHEFAHILLGISGICKPEEASHTEEDIQVEKFCNHFAGAFLIPQQALKADEDVLSIAGQGMTDDALHRVSVRYKVSTQVVLRRLLICDFISKEEYLSKLDDLLAKQKVRPVGRGAFKMSASKRCLVQNGRFLVSLALEAVAKDSITYSDVADYLSIDLKNLEKVEALV